MANINRDYLVVADLKSGKITSPAMSFYNTDKNIANLFVKLQITMRTNPSITCFVNKEEASNYNVKLTVVKPKTTMLVDLVGVIQDSDVMGNGAVYLFDMPQNFTDQVGRYICELEITCMVNGREEVVTCDPFEYVVKESVVTGLNTEIETNPDTPVLKQLIDEVRYLQENGGSIVNLSKYQKIEDDSLDTNNKTVVGGINELNDSKVDKVEGKGLSTIDFTTEKDTKLSGIEDNANNYVHPAKHNADIITQDATHRFVTDAEKEKWNNKSDFSGSYNDLTEKPNIPSIDGLATEVYVENKVASIVNSAPETLDTLNELATALGNDPNFATTVANQIGTKASTEYVNTELAKKVNNEGYVATENNYSTAEKTKLANIEEGANNYIHPENHSASIITQDDMHRFITDAERQAWNNKSDFDGDYNKLSNKPNMPTKVSQIENDSRYTTETYVKNEIANAQLGSGEVDLSGYATKEDLKAKADKSELNNKVDKAEGKGLSTNDLTNDLKTNYDSAYAHSQTSHAPSNAEPNVQSDWNENNASSDAYIKNKPIIPSAYTLPIASTTVLGGVKVGAGLSISNGVLSATSGGTADSVDWNNIQNKPSVFTPATHNHDDVYARKTEIPIVDVTKKYVDTELSKKSPIHEHPYLPNTTKVPTKTSQLQNDSNFATETFVTTKIEEAQLGGGSGSIAKSYVTYEEFGAKCDGVYDDGIAIKLAHEYANQNNLDIKPDNTKTYYIKQTHSIPIFKNTDFNNATFIIDDTVEVDRKQHVFRVKSKKEKIQINSLNFTVNRSTIKLDNLKGHGMCLVQVVNSNKKQFIREGASANEGTDQQDYFIIDNEGAVLTDIIWDFEQITSCTLYPMDDTYLTIKNANFITKSNGKELQSNYFDRGFAINRSNVILNNINHRVRDEKPGSPYHGFICGQYCANILLKDCSVQSRMAYKVSGTSTWMGTYDIEMFCVVNVKLDNVVDVAFDNKQRWGVFASNFCKNIIIENSTLSRVDAHQGARNIAIRKSVIGNQGIRVIGSGLCLIEDSKILNSTSLITLRSDYGSSWEGTLIVRRTYWQPDSTYAYPRIINFSNSSNHDFGYTCYFPRLIIDDLEVDDTKLLSNGSYSNIPIINNNTSMFGTDITGFRYPYHFTDSIECKNMRTKSDKGFVLFNSSTINLYNKNRFTYKEKSKTSTNMKELHIIPNTTIVLDNVKLHKVPRRMGDVGNLFAIMNVNGSDTDGFISNTNHVLPLIRIKNCKNVYALTSNHPMVLELENSVVSTLLNVGVSTRMKGKATGCLFKPEVDVLYQYVNTNYGDFTFTDCNFDIPLINGIEEKNPNNLLRIYSFLSSFDSVQNKYNLIDVKMDNCNIYDGSRNMDLSNHVTSLNGIKFWKGSQEAYNRLNIKDNSTLYIIVG